MKKLPIQQSLETILSSLNQSTLGIAFILKENLILEYANVQFLSYLNLSPTNLKQSFADVLEDSLKQDWLSFIEECFFNDKKNQRIKTINNIVYDINSSLVYSESTNEVIGLNLIINNEIENDYSHQKPNLDFSPFGHLNDNELISNIIYKGLDPIIEFANNKMLEIFDQKNQIFGKRLFDIFPELEQQEFYNIYKEVYTTGKKRIVNGLKIIYTINENIKTEYINLFLLPKLDHNNKVYSIILSSVNVTDLMLAKDKLRNNEELLKIFLEHVPVSINVLEGENFNYKLSNSISSKIWGHDIVVGTNVEDTVPYIKERPIYHELKEAYKTGHQISKTGHQYLNKDNETKYINYIIQPIKNQDQVKYILTLGYDVTNEMMYKKQLEANERRFKILADFMPQFVWTTDKNGKANYFNKNWYNYFDLSKDLNLDHIFWQLLHKDDFDRVHDTWYSAINNQGEYEIEYRMIHPKTNAVKWYLARSIPIYDENNDVEVWIGTCTDIDEYKKLQKQKDDFLGIASHELKTPLTSLKLYAQLIEKNLKKSNDVTNSQFINQMENQIDKLNNLIIDLLDVTRIQNGKILFNETVFNLDDLLLELVEEQQMISNFNILVKKNELGAIYSDNERIGQVITNLMSNAIKYSPNHNTIVVHAERKINTIIIAVEDFGIGIPEDKIPYVFDQYMRVGSEYEKTVSGLGLGLYISAEIVKRINGKLYVTSELGKGSTFFLEIPIK